MRRLAADSLDGVNSQVTRASSTSALRSSAAAFLFAQRGFKVLEQMLPSTGSFCVGSAVTLADIVLVPQVVNARRYPQIDLAPFPNIVRIDAALKKLKPFHDAAPEQQPEATQQ